MSPFVVKSFSLKLNQGIKWKALVTLNVTLDPICHSLRNYLGKERHTSSHAQTAITD